MTQVEEYKDTLLNWLRCEISVCRSAAKLQRKDDGFMSYAEALGNAVILEGQALAYEDVIKHIRGLKEREFQLEKKRGTL